MPKEIHNIELEPKDNWLDGPLPVSYNAPSGWTGMEKIMPALLDRFDVGRNTALEFGVEYGHSTAILAQLFDHVTGVDIFVGDDHSSHRANYYNLTSKNLERWKNITLVQEDYEKWISRDALQYDLIHVDILHTYDVTYKCGLWAAAHSPVVIFHDTEFIWPEVKQAILRIAEETDREFYNYPHCQGLGILV